MATSTTTRPIGGDSLPRAEFWAPRRLRGRDVTRLVAELDPVRDDAEIVHLTMEDMTPPAMAHLGYASGAARTVASPRIAERATRRGSGDQLVRPVARNVDTLTFFSELFRLGHRSAAGVAVAERIQDIHRAVGRIRNEDQVFVLAQLMLGDERIGRALGHDPYTDHQREALFQFWLGVGRAMRLHGMPETRAEMAAWATDYEDRTFEPTDIGHAAAEGYLRGFTDTIPASRRRIARTFFVAMMDEPMRTTLGFDTPNPAVTAAAKLQWRAFSATTPWRSMRLDTTWTAALGGRRPGLDLQRVGYATYDAGEAVPAGCPVHATATTEAVS